MSETRVRQEIGPWVVTYAWPNDVDQGGPRTLTIAPAETADPAELAGGLSTTVTRRLDFVRAADEWRQLRRSAAIATDDPEDHRRRQRAALRDAVNRGVNEHYLAVLSAAYVDTVRHGGTGVTATLAELVGRSPETVRAHLKEARKRGLLTASKGRAGGQLTDRAWRVLRIDPQES